MPKLSLYSMACGAAMLIGSGLLAPPAQAGYIVTLTEQGTSVVANGSGRLDLTGLTSQGSTSVGTFINLVAPSIITGPAGGGSAGDYHGPIAGTGIWGPGSGSASASSGSGDIVGINRHNGDLFVPATYMSDDPLSSSSTFASQSFTSLGVTPGTYISTWGSGADQNFTVQIGPAAAVPEPSTVSQLAAAFAGLALASIWRRRRQT